MSIHDIIMITSIRTVAISMILLLVAHSVPVAASSSVAINTGDKCECAAFKGTSVEVGEEPMIIQNPTNTTCDDTGVKLCKAICTDLVKIGKERAPGVICFAVKNGDKMKPSLFTRVCDKPWTYADLTAEEPICCVNGEPVSCVKEKEA